MADGIRLRRLASVKNDGRALERRELLLELVGRPETVALENGDQLTAGHAQCPVVRVARRHYPAVILEDVVYPRVGELTNDLVGPIRGSIADDDLLPARFGLP